MKLTLSHLHRHPDELFVVDGHRYDNYIDAFKACHHSHQHEDDHYGTTLEAQEDEFEAEEFEDELLEEDWMELARQLPNRDLSQEDVDLLGRRDVDINFDWSPFVGKCADLQDDYWTQCRDNHPRGQDVEDLPLEARDSLNPEQRVVYDTFIGHFQHNIHTQILLHLDSSGGTGKSFLIKVLSSHLQQEARLRYGDDAQSPVLRTAPTGVASNQISGQTLHSLLRLPINKNFQPLQDADIGALQNRLRHLKYLVIDEKSMLGLQTLGWIDSRLRQVFPDRQDEWFGGVSILLVGDFF